MRYVMTVLLIAGLAGSAHAAKKEAPKPAPAAAKKKPAREKGDLLVGALSKTQVDGKDAYILQLSPSEKIELNAAMAKKMYIDLDSFVGKRVAVSCFQDDNTKAIKSFVWVKTEADYKKMSGGK